MKKLLLILFLSIAYLCTTHAQSFTKLEVKQSMRRVADWQIGHYNRAVYGDLNWVNATFFLGLAYWAEIAEKDDQDDFYYKWLTRLGSRNYWQKNIIGICGTGYIMQMIFVLLKPICICTKSTSKRT